MKLMDDAYDDDSSGHIMCEGCGMCITCGDCKECGCGEEVVYEDAEPT